MSLSVVATQVVVATQAARPVAGVSEVVALVAAAVGACLGAGIAFLLEEMRRRRVERNGRYSRLLEAQIVLGMQLNTLVNIQQQYLNEHRAAQNRHMLLVPLHMSMSELRADIASLGFIAEVDDVEILHRVYLAEQAYITATTALTVSNSKIQELRYDGALAHGPVNQSTGEAQAVFDGAKLVILKQHIDGMYASVDEAVEWELEAIDELRGVIKRQFSERKSLTFEVPPQPPVPG